MVSMLSSSLPFITQKKNKNKENSDLRRKASGKIQLNWGRILTPAERERERERERETTAV